MYWIAVIQLLGNNSFLTLAFIWTSAKLCICCPYLVLDCYLWESRRALVDDITAIKRLPSLTGPDAWTFFFLHSASVCGDKWGQWKMGLKWLAGNGKKTRARFILIRTHKLSSTPSTPRIKQKPEDPPPPTPPPPRDIRMHEISPLGFSMIYNFLVCDMCKETCKNPVCTEVWSWNTFVCLEMPQNSLSVSVNVQLHSTADAGDHFTRKSMNLLLGKKK